MWNKKTTYYYKHHKKLPLTLLTLSVKSEMRIIMKKNQSINLSQTMVFEIKGWPPKMWVYLPVWASSLSSRAPSLASSHRRLSHSNVHVITGLLYGGLWLSASHHLTDLSNSTLPILLNIWELKIAQTTLIVDSSHDCTRWIYTSSLRFFTSTSSCFILIVC